MCIDGWETAAADTARVCSSRTEKRTTCNRLADVPLSDFSAPPQKTYLDLTLLTTLLDCLKPVDERRCSHGTLYWRWSGSTKY